MLATKFTNGAAPEANRLVAGNSRKAMVASVEEILKRLNTDRIKVYRAAEFPARRVAHAATLDELTHTVPIAAIQFEHSLVHREPDACMQTLSTRRSPP